jgi:hypothetical protein
LLVSKSFLAISSQSPQKAISRTRLSSWQFIQMHSPSTEVFELLTTKSNFPLCPFVTPRHGSRRKYSLSIVEKACLLIGYLAMDVLLLGALKPAGMGLPSRCLGMGLYVAI